MAEHRYAYDELDEAGRQCADAWAQEWAAKIAPYEGPPFYRGFGYCDGSWPPYGEPPWYVIVQLQGTKFYIDVTVDENGYPVFAERPFWKRGPEGEIWMREEGFPQYYNQYESKVVPHLGMGQGEGIHIFRGEYMVVQSHGTKFYLEIAPDENGLPVLPERPFWKLYAGD